MIIECSLQYNSIFYSNKVKVNNEDQFNELKRIKHSLLTTQTSIELYEYEEIFKHYQYTVIPAPIRLLTMTSR